jgi:hypothetical protein
LKEPLSSESERRLVDWVLAVHSGRLNFYSAKSLPGVIAHALEEHNKHFTKEENKIPLSELHSAELVYSALK